MDIDGYWGSKLSDNPASDFSSTWSSTLETKSCCPAGTDEKPSYSKLRAAGNFFDCAGLPQVTNQLFGLISKYSTQIWWLIIISYHFSHESRHLVGMHHSIFRHSNFRSNWSYHKFFSSCSCPQNGWSRVSNGLGQATHWTSTAPWWHS